MNYPIWDLPASGLLIAAIAIVHVFISHFAVGGGLFLVVTERKARREGDAELLSFVKLHTRFFVLLTLVLGAMTGVGIWFTIGLVHPQATSALINTFVWAWAIEWTFFVVEIAAAMVYYYGWDKLSPSTHQARGLDLLLGRVAESGRDQRHPQLHAHARRLAAHAVVLGRHPQPDLRATIMFVLGIAAGLVAMVSVIAAGQSPRLVPLLCAGVACLLVTIVAMIFTRDFVRRVSLELAGFQPVEWTMPQWAPIAIFGILLVAAIALVAWMARALMAAPASAPASHARVA
jgi:hypothetical protein